MLRDMFAITMAIFACTDGVDMGKRWQIQRAIGTGRCAESRRVQLDW
jgi:hypothetical protein